MSNSSLVSYTKLSPNHSGRRNHAIDSVAIHCMAGNLSVESCGNLFAKSSTGASSNYGIGSDGRIALYVDEANRTWCTSSAQIDNRAVTIEVANDGGANTGWHVSDLALNSLVNLLADICRRNGIKALKWRADKSLQHQIDKQNMYVHRWVKAKACPGDYLYNMHYEIANRVNMLLGDDGFDYSAVFDADFYAKSNPDVVAVYGNDANALRQHFAQYGMNEARLAKDDFYVKGYRARYADLEKAFGNDWKSYYRHYCTNGKAEGRIAI